MELKDLVGLHQLLGVDMTNEEIQSEWGDYFENCETISFTLDKKTYTAIEDPDDGYRSAMKEIKESKATIRNKFSPVEVIGIMRLNDSDEIIDFYDIKTGKIILSIGTHNYDDYYPMFVAEFTPENMIINNNLG